MGYISYSFQNCEFKLLNMSSFGVLCCAVGVIDFFTISLLPLFQNIRGISFLKNQTSLSLIKFVEKYINIDNIESVSFVSSWDEFHIVFL